MKRVFIICFVGVAVLSFYTTAHAAPIAQQVISDTNYTSAESTSTRPFTFQELGNGLSGTATKFRLLANWCENVAVQGYTSYTYETATGSAQFLLGNADPTVCDGTLRDTFQPIVFDPTLFYILSFNYSPVISGTASTTPFFQRVFCKFNTVGDNGNYTNPGAYTCGFETIQNAYFVFDDGLENSSTTADRISIAAPNDNISANFTDYELNLQYATDTTPTSTPGYSLVVYVSRNPDDLAYSNNFDLSSHAAVAASRNVSCTGASRLETCDASLQQTVLAHSLQAYNSHTTYYARAVLNYGGNNTVAVSAIKQFTTGAASGALYQFPTIPTSTCPTFSSSTFGWVSCNIVESGKAVVNALIEAGSGVIGDLITLFQHAFPFVVFQHISDDLHNPIVQNSGNVSIRFINKDYVLFSSSTVENAASSTGFSGFRQFADYAMYALTGLLMLVVAIGAVALMNSLQKNNP